MSEWFYIPGADTACAVKVNDVVEVWRCRECQWYVSAAVPVDADAVKCPECGSEKKRAL